MEDLFIVTIFFCAFLPLLREDRTVDGQDARWEVKGTGSGKVPEPRIKLKEADALPTRLLCRHLLLFLL